MPFEKRTVLIEMIFIKRWHDKNSFFTCD